MYAVGNAVSRRNGSDGVHIVDAVDPTVQGIRAELITLQDVSPLWPPLENSDEMLAALNHPVEGRIAPADVTQAMANGAPTAMRRSSAKCVGHA